jgi:NADH-quinone oxidoreductase subunit E
MGGIGGRKASPPERVSAKRERNNMQADKTKIVSGGLSESARAELLQYAGRYPIKRSAILHGLRLVQREAGYLTEAGMRDVASLLEITPHDVYDVATFYTMFYLRPKGEYLLQVCRTLPCALGGAEKLLGHLEAQLGIRAGETTSDGKFTLMAVECLAACDKAPVMQVNDDYHESLTLEQVDRLLAEWRRTSDVGARAVKSRAGSSDAPTPRGRRDGQSHG